MKRHSRELVERVLQMRLEGYSMVATAEALGIRESAVNMIVWKARCKGDARASPMAPVERNNRRWPSPPAAVAPFQAAKDAPPAPKRRVTDWTPPAGIVPLGEPAPGRSALDQRLRRR